MPKKGYRNFLRLEKKRG